MRGKSYLSLGGVSMGIAGSIVDQPFFEQYLGMRVEAVDMSELDRRLEEGIYDPVEFEQGARLDARRTAARARTATAADKQKTREEQDRDWETVVKMALITRDLLVGNPRLAELGFGEEAMGRNAILGGFQGQRQWTDHFPNGDFMEAILNSRSTGTAIRAPHVFATENDSLNGATMLLMYLLTNRAQIFADVRTYWSPEAVERVTGHEPEGLAADGFIHLINSGAATLDATGAMTDADGEPAMKPFWEITEADVEAALAATTWYPANRGYFRGGGYSSQFVTSGGMPVTMARINLVAGTGPVLQIAEGWTVDLPQEVHDVLDQRTDPTWPTHWFVPRTNGRGSVPRRVHGHGQLGRQPRRDQLRPHRRGPDQPRLDAADPGPHAQRARGGRLPAERLVEPRHGRPRGRRLPGLRELRPAVRAPLAAPRRRTPSSSGLRQGLRLPLDRNRGRPPWTSFCSGSTSARRAPRASSSARTGRSSRAPSARTRLSLPAPGLGGARRRVDLVGRARRDRPRAGRGRGARHASWPSACSGIGPCLLPVDADGRAAAPGDPLRRRHPRRRAEIDELTARYGAEAILARGGTPLTSQAVGPSCSGSGATSPRLWARTRGSTWPARSWSRG